MSTRSLIGIAAPDGSVRAVYCHFDGYIEGVGATLLRHYNSEEKARELLDLGDLSSLGERIAPAPGEDHSFDHPVDDVTVAYHRDRGEKLSPAKLFESKVKMAKEGEGRFWAEYCYVWENGEWQVAMTMKPVYMPVADALDKIAAAKEKEVEE